MKHINGWPQWGVISPRGKVFKAHEKEPAKYIQKYWNTQYFFNHTDAVRQASRNKVRTGSSYAGSATGWIRWYVDRSGTVYSENQKDLKRSEKYRINKVEQPLLKAGVKFHTVLDDRGRY